MDAFPPFCPRLLDGKIRSNTRPVEGSARQSRMRVIDRSARFLCYFASVCAAARVSFIPIRVRGLRGGEHPLDVFYKSKFALNPSQRSELSHADPR